jgi:hypothetical protein
MVWAWFEAHRYCDLELKRSWIGSRMRAGICDQDRIKAKSKTPPGTNGKDGPASAFLCFFRVELCDLTMKTT